MPILWFEPLRLAMQSSRLACRQCQLLTALAMQLPWALWAPLKGPTDER
jgi:hypothetical protein